MYIKHKTYDFRANRITSWDVTKKEGNYTQNDVAGEKYLEKENKFRRRVCMAEDCLHMEMVKNFWTGMKTAFEEQPHQGNIKNPCVRKKIQKNILAKTFDYMCERYGRK